jgi:hypothetical protein
MITEIQSSPQDTLRNQLREAHATPSFDLARLRWIPVLYHSGEVVQVGIDDLFGSAHEIKDLAEPDPIVRAALRRFTEALCAQLIRLEGSDGDSWRSRAEHNSGFSQSEVAALIRDQHEHLWLYHPMFPFLQDIRLVDALTKPEWFSSDDLVANLPGDGEAAWFVKPGDPASARGLDPVSAARGLVARWFYHLPGNSAEVNTSEGTNTAQSGGAFSEGIATATHAFRISRVSLATTLLRNMTSDMIATTYLGDVDHSGPAWTYRDRSSISQDGLYLGTLTASSVLLAAPREDLRIHVLVRGPVPQAKGGVKIARDLALDHDAHRVVILSTKKDGATKETTLRKGPSEHPLRILDSLHRAALDSSQGRLRGVINEEDLWITGSRGRHDESIELFLADKQGTGSSPNWSETRVLSLPAAHVDPDTRQFQSLVPILGACFDDRTGIVSRLRWAILDALGENKHHHHISADRLVAIARGRWLQLAAARIEYTISTESDSVECNRLLFLDARTVFHEVLAPYAKSTRYAASIVKAQHYLWEKKS